jgi:endonuclease YncB( thermonuclease family)
MARRRSQPGAMRPPAARTDVRALTMAAILLGALGYYSYKYFTAKPLPPLTGIATVADGDTIEIYGTRIRLEGIDAVELDQTCQDANKQSWPCGRAALRAVRSHIQGHELRCDPKGLDQFKRVLAVCFMIPDGSDLNAWIVQQGWALAYGHAQVYRSEQDEAQSAKRGIWAGTFTPPREWRQQHPR